MKEIVSRDNGSYLSFSLNCLSDFTVSHYTESEDTMNLAIELDKDMMKLDEQVNVSLCSVVKCLHTSKIQSVHKLWKTTRSAWCRSCVTQKMRRTTLLLTPAFFLHPQRQKHFWLTMCQCARTKKVQYMFRKIKWKCLRISLALFKSHEKGGNIVL